MLKHLDLGISELELFKYNDAKSSLKEAIKLSDNESLFIFELFLIQKVYKNKNN